MYLALSLEIGEDITQSTNTTLCPHFPQYNLEFHQISKLTPRKVNENSKGEGIFKSTIF